jgi:hypothetical protein
VDLRAGLDNLEKRKFFTLPGLELRPLVRPARRKAVSIAKKSEWLISGRSTVGLLLSKAEELEGEISPVLGLVSL